MMKFFRFILLVLFWASVFFIGFYLAAPRKAAVLFPVVIGIVMAAIYIATFKPKEQKVSFLSVIIPLCVAVPIGFLVGRETYREPTQEEKAQAYVKERLKDPYSAQFRNQRGYCGEVNAKNAMGAYAGYKRYVAADAYSVYFDTEGSIDTAENRVEKELFEKEWAKYCY